MAEALEEVGESGEEAAGPEEAAAVVETVGGVTAEDGSEETAAAVATSFFLTTMRGFRGVCGAELIADRAGEGGGTRVAALSLIRFQALRVTRPPLTDIGRMIETGSGAGHTAAARGVVARVSTACDSLTFCFFAAAASSLPSAVAAVVSASFTCTAAVALRVLPNRAVARLAAHAVTSCLDGTAACFTGEFIGVGASASACFRLMPLSLLDSIFASSSSANRARPLLSMLVCFNSSGKPSLLLSNSGS